MSKDFKENFNISRSAKMKSKFLKYISELLDLPVILNDNNSNPEETVNNFFGEFYESKSIQESIKFLDKYQKMPKSDKDGLVSDCEQLELDLNDLFDFQDFQEKVEQAQKNYNNIIKLTLFFYIFQDNKIQSRLPVSDDDDLDSENPNIPTLIQQFNFYQDPTFPITFFLDDNVLHPLSVMIEAPILKKIESITNNIFIQYVLKGFILENPEILFDDLIQYIDQQLEKDCKDKFSNEEINKMTLATFKTEIYDPWINLKKFDDKFNAYEFDNNAKSLEQLFKTVNSTQNQIKFSTIVRLINTVPSLDTISSAFSVYRENNEVFGKCPFFSFKIIEKNKDIMNFINSNQNYNSLSTKRLIEFDESKMRDLAFIIQTKTSLAKNFISFIKVLFMIIMSYNPKATNIYDIVSVFFESDEAFSSLKMQTSNSCVIGEKKEALYKLMFIIDWLKSGNNDFNQDFNPFIVSHCQYLNNSKDEFDIDNSVKLISDNCQFFKEIIDGNTPQLSTEYKYVMSFQNGDYIFAVDQNGVTLESPTNSNATIEYVKLKLIASSLNITMFESRGDFEFQKTAMKFVSRFQLCEKLKSELNLLSNYYDEKAQAKLQYKIEEDENEEEEAGDEDNEKNSLSLKSQITKIINARLDIEKSINKYYVDSLTLFTKENLCLSYSCAAKEDKENLKNIILSTINKKSIKSDNYIDPKIDEICNKLSSKEGSYEQKFEYYLDLLNDLVQDALSNGDIYEVPKTISNKESQVSISSFKRRIMEKTISILQYTEYQYLPDLIFDLFFSLQREMPDYNQMLLCTKDTTLNRVSCFLHFYNTHNHTKKVGAASNFKIFLLINPQDLESESSEFLVKHLRKYSSDILGSARLIVLSTTRSDSFTDIYRSWNIDNIDNCRYQYNKNYEPIIYNDKTESYMIYTTKPRVGKSHLIMKEIFDKYKNNVYYRIIIDSTTTLTRLISMIKDAPVIEGRTTCYHLNIEGSKNEPFMIYITMLYLFASLNDGLTSPFVLSNKCKTVFFFEFSPHPPLNEEKFVEKVFPIGKYIKKLKIPEDREFFSLDEYCVSHENGYSTIICKKANRKELIETYALLELRKKHAANKKDLFMKVPPEVLIPEKKQFGENGKSNPKAVYDSILALFKQEWIPDQYRQESPLISQLDDVSHVVVNLSEFIFSFELFIQEKDSIPVMPIRFMALSLAFETAIINCGLPYNYTDDGVNEIDKIRLDRIKNWFDSVERLLVVTGLNYRHKNPCGIRTIQHSVHVRHKKTIAEEFGVDIVQGLTNLVYTPEKWRELEKDNVRMLEELEPIFDLKSIGFLSSFVICVSLYDSLSNEDKKSLDELTKNVKDYFPQLRKTLNFNKKKHPHLFPQKSSKTCDKFINCIAHIFRYQRDLPEIKDEKITTFPKAIDVIQQYALSHTLLKTYSLTLHNIELFLHIVYRVFSQLPIIMMGETGSGKTYSVKFLQEVIGPNTELEIRCFDGGTNEDDIKSYVHWKIDEFISKKSIQKIEEDRLQLLFFFDEVNTAPCQWFIKDLIIDRFLDGKKIPDYVKFICAMNPKRQLPSIVKQRLRGLEQKHQSELSNLVYKVRQMPESFVPYLFSADAPRTIPKTIENVENYEDLSEFEKVTEKVIDKELNEEPLPLDKKINKTIHFSETSSYCTCFDFKFFTNGNDNLMNSIFKENTSIKTHSAHKFISRLNAYAGRLFIDKENGIYRDESFMSIREPKRCVHLMRWFYKKGIFAFSQNKANSKMQANEIFRMSFMLSFAVTYWLRLSDFKLEKQKECDRDSFIKKIIRKWEELIKMNEFKFLEPILRPPTFDEWINGTVKLEQQKYANLFVNDDEGLSKNDALCENIWTTYISLSNNIPLWIIGRPGTSKSLAVNIVLAKLFTGRTIPNIPPLVYQTFMCSSDSRSEALISQMSRIAEKSLLLPTDGTITALLLEEIGHADLSPYLPLKCLNHIIDDGFQVTTVDENNKKESKALLITLIGLSNYKMDSAKLNRGILIIRDELSSEQKKKTALDIFRSTALSLFKVDSDKFNENDINNFVDRYRNKIEAITSNYHNANKVDKYIGLRDFYGVIKLVTSVLFREGENNMNRIIYSIKRNFSGDKNSLDLYRSSVEIFETKQCAGDKKIKSAEPSSLDLIVDNLSEDWSNLKNPLSRHILIVTEGNSALSLLISELHINSLIYSDNFSGLPDDEWISNDLKQFAKSMASGETIVFIGNHPCFNCLYDVFNLRYENIYGENFALISFAGDSFLVKVHPRFKAIIIMEDKEYETLPAPFLNRFEKVFLNYDSVLSHNKKEASENYENFIKGKFPEFKVNASFSSLSKEPQYYFGCYNQHHFNAITYCKDQMQLSQDEVDQLVFLSCQPSKAVVALTKYNQKQIQYLSDIMNELSSLKSSILHLLYYYNNTDYLLPIKKNKKAMNRSLPLKFYEYWKKEENKIPGIQATLLVPFYQNIKQEDFKNFGELIYIQLSEKINEGLINSRIKKCMKKSNSVITVIEVQIPGENLQQRIYHLQAVFEKIRKELSIEKANISLHTFILIEMRVWENDLSFVQSVEWPVIFLDTCISSNLKPIDNSLKTIDISSLIFNPLIQIFPDEEKEDDQKNKKAKKKEQNRCDNKINMDDFIKIVKSDLLLIYAKEKRSLLSASLENEVVSKYLMDFFLYLISVIQSFNLCLSTSQNKITYREDNQPWFMKFLRTLYSPPPSLIEYLSVKLTRIAENIYSTLTQTILSCADDFEPDLDNQANIDTINFIFTSDSFQNKLENSVLAESPQMSQIEYRYLNPNKVPMWQMYKYMWEIVIYDPNQILNPAKNRDGDEEEEEEEEWKEEEDSCDKVLTYDLVEKFFIEQLESSNLVDVYIKPKKIPDPFYAAYILLICPGINVGSSDRDQFNNLINCIKLIISSVYGSKLSLAKTMVFLLNDNLKSYLATISQCYSFIPDSSSIKFMKYQKNLDEDEQLSKIQQNIAIVVKNIITNIFDYQFRNIIELKNFFTFGYPVIRSISVEFNYTLSDHSIWDFKLINSYLNILSLYNLIFLLLPENVVFKDSMWKNKKLNIDIDNPPKSSKDVIKLVSDIINAVKKASKIDDNEVTKIYKALAVNYANNMSSVIYHGFCDPELD